MIPRLLNNSYSLPFKTLQNFILSLQTDILKYFFLISTLSGTLEVIQICWYRSALHDFPNMLLFNLNTSIDRKLTPYQRNPSYLEADLILWKLSLHWPQICLHLIFTFSSYFSLLLISKELIKLFLWIFSILNKSFIIHVDDGIRQVGGTSPFHH